MCMSVSVHAHARVCVCVATTGGKSSGQMLAKTVGPGRVESSQTRPDWVLSSQAEGEGEGEGEGDCEGEGKAGSSQRCQPALPNQRSARPLSCQTTCPLSSGQWTAWTVPTAVGRAESSIIHAMSLKPPQLNSAVGGMPSVLLKALTSVVPQHDGHDSGRVVEDRTRLPRKSTQPARRESRSVLPNNVAVVAMFSTDQ